MTRQKEPSCAEIQKALREYNREEGAIDAPLFDRVGNRIRQQGHVGPDDLYLITAWKSAAPWGVKHARGALRKNTLEAIKDTTEKAIAMVATDDGEEAAVEAIRKLTTLHHIGIPIASAVLAFYDPQRFGAIDPNAWRALGWGEKRDGFEPEEYGRYVTRVREVAEECRLTPRQVDAALYQIGGEG